MSEPRDDIYFHGIVGRSRALRRVVRQIRDVAPLEVPVLVHGESGVGKELVARAIHLESGRRSGPFVPVNSGAVPTELVASELFGHTKGSFTGATRARDGYFSAAGGGTIFLDEIGTMGNDMQVALLRILETGSYTPVGSSDERSSDARVVAATNEVVRRGQSHGSIREDLYYRLSVFVIRVPPLRKRPADIPVLAHHVLGQRIDELGLGLRSFSSGAIRAMQRYDWPGNVRELINVVTRAAISAKGRQVTEDEVEQSLRARQPAQEPAASPAEGSAGDVADDQPEIDADSLEPGQTLEAVERKLITLTLDHVDGNRTKAARMLGISRKSLYNKLKRFQLGQ